jgi:hypothetical protein
MARTAAASLPSLTLLVAASPLSIAALVAFDDWPKVIIGPSSNQSTLEEPEVQLA